MVDLLYGSNDGTLILIIHLVTDWKLHLAASCSQLKATVKRTI